MVKGDAGMSVKHYTRAHTHYSKVSPRSFEAADCALQIGAAKAKSGTSPLSSPLLSSHPPPSSHLLFLLGDYKSAEPMLKAAQEGYDEHRGPLHLSSLSVVRERALLLLHDKRFKESLYCLQSLATRQAKVSTPLPLSLPLLSNSICGSRIHKILIMLLNHSAMLLPLPTPPPPPSLSLSLLSNPIYERRMLLLYQ